jgi:hypothetical protein
MLVKLQALVSPVSKAAQKLGLSWQMCGVDLVFDVGQAIDKPGCAECKAARNKGPTKGLLFCKPQFGANCAVNG